MEDWDKRYRRKVLDFVKADPGVDLADVSIESNWSAAWSYSTYTSESAEFSITISWVDINGDRMYRCLTNDDAVDLLRSFG